MNLVINITTIKHQTNSTWVNVRLNLFSLHIYFIKKPNKTKKDALKADSLQYIYISNWLSRFSFEAYILI